MMTGEFHNIAPEAITVNRDARIRRELNGIEALAASIKATGGLIHPIVLTREHTLVAGERRLTAVKFLGLTEIPFQYVDELSQKELRYIELEENARRLDLTPQEQAASIAELHELHKAEDAEWTLEKTAKALNRDRSGVGKYLLINKHKDNPLIQKSENFSKAAGLAVRIEERQRADEREVWADTHLGLNPHTHFLNAPFQEWAASYTGPKFNLLHCDFPYGINADKAQQGTAAKFAGYDDSPETYSGLLRFFVEHQEIFCADSCHLIFWFSMQYYEWTYDTLMLNGWEIDHFPLVWHKSDNAGFLPDSTRGPRRTYETAFFGRRGDRKIIRAKANSYSGPTVEGHTHEKPVEMLTHFMEMLVDENTAILDPTCGSGSALRAACRLGATRFLGLDTNTDHIADANRRFAE